MHIFLDDLGREWQVIIDPYTIGQVRAKTGVNLYDLGTAFEEIAKDPTKLAGVLYSLCGDQTDGKFTLREFCRGLTSDVLQSAAKAFEDEYLFFSPSQTQPVLRRATEAGRAIAEMAKQKQLMEAEAKMESLDLQLLNANGSFGKSPDGSASTHDA